MKKTIVILLLLVSCVTQQPNRHKKRLNRRSEAKNCAIELSQTMAPELATDFCKKLYNVHEK